MYIDDETFSNVPRQRTRSQLALPRYGGMRPTEDVR